VSLAFKKKHITLGISANLIFRKGIDQVIRFLSLPDASKFGLIIIGDGPLKSDLISLARQFSVEERCLFLGFKQNAIDYYRFFDVYVMSSRSEGFGLCVIEAASQKIPIVCNSLNVFNELFDTHEICRFKLDDVKSLLEALTYTVQNKDQLSFLVNEKYIKNYTSKIMSNKYFKLYKEVLNEPKDFSSKYEATTKNRNLLFAHWNFYSLCLQSSKIRTNR
jgi:glycosyltransferase involved in cell wall biosynthesis